MDAPFHGDVAFLFTDIEGSTRLWQEHPTTMRTALDAHFEVLRDAIEDEHGAFLEDTGDGALAAFPQARAAVRAAVSAQRILARTTFDGPGRLRVRMGIDLGDVPAGTARYRGTILNRTARIMDAAHGGQVVVSDQVRDRVDDDVAGFRDLGHHRLKDLRRPERLWQVVTEDLAEDFPPLRTLEGFDHNLPAQFSAFVGREDELRSLSEALGRARLVTLLGPGGVGKSRLAVQTAAEVSGAYPDGVWLVELAPVSDPALVAQSVAETVRAPADPGRSSLERVVSHLRDHRTLIVMDNCEHVLDAAADIVQQLLSAGPQVRVLATSREALNLVGESIHAVAPLPLGDAGGGAVDLFIERAVAVRPELEPADHVATITQVCHRLDGLPLAIELAAARVRSLSIDDLAARLDDRFRLLTGGSRTALPRQRTLEATVAWSYDLLDDEEQDAFEVLSVFAGGCTLEAAEALLGPVAMDLVTSLAERSLLTVDLDAPGGARYGMLETVRAYAGLRLAARPDASAVRDHHLSWAAEFAAAARDHLDGPEQMAWVQRVRVELGNLRAAMEHAVGPGDPVLGLQVAADLYRYWFVRAVAEGRSWLERLLEDPDATGDDDSLRGRSLYACGSLVQQMGDYERAAELLGRSVVAFRRVDEPRGLAYALHHLARAEFGLVDPRENLERFEESLALAREVGDPVCEALNLLFTNVHAVMEGDIEHAAQEATLLATLADAIGAPQLLAHSSECQGWTERERDDAAAAAGHYAAALEVYQQLGNRACSAHALEGAALTIARWGDAEDAAELLGATEALRERIAVPVPPYEQLFYRELIAELDERLDAPTREAAVARGRALGAVEALRRAGAALEHGR